MFSPDNVIVISWFDCTQSSFSFFYFHSNNSFLNSPERIIQKELGKPTVFLFTFLALSKSYYWVLQCLVRGNMNMWVIPDSKRNEWIFVQDILISFWHQFIVLKLQLCLLWYTWKNNHWNHIPSQRAIQQSLSTINFSFKRDLF